MTTFGSKIADHKIVFYAILELIKIEFKTKPGHLKKLLVLQERLLDTFNDIKMFMSKYHIRCVTLNDSDFRDVLRIPIYPGFMGGLHLKNFCQVTFYNSFQVSVFNLQ
jgi:hypothetical protein